MLNWMKPWQAQLCSPEELDLIEPQHTVHVAVHVQQHFFNPESSKAGENERQQLVDATAHRIDGVASWLSDVEIPTFWVCTENEDLSQEARALYKAAPNPNDKLISADQGTSILNANMFDLLREHATKTLLISGSYASICETKTVQDALAAGYQVFIMQDCLMDSDDDVELKGMFSGCSTNNRARLTTSAAVLEHLGIERPGAPEPMAPIMWSRSFL